MIAHRSDRRCQQDENPGRCNLYELDGYTGARSISHTTRSTAMSALFDMARAVPAKRRALCFGQAGDRTDELIRELARARMGDRPRPVSLSRSSRSTIAAARHGDVFGIISDELVKHGRRLQSRSFTTRKNSIRLMRRIDWAQPGDLVDHARARRREARARLGSASWVLRIKSRISAAISSVLLGDRMSPARTCLPRSSALLTVTICLRATSRASYVSTMACGDTTLIFRANRTRATDCSTRARRRPSAGPVRQGA